MTETLMMNGLPGTETMGPVFLYHYKQGVPVTRALVLLSHVNVHAIWRDNSKRSMKLRTTYPLETTFSRLGQAPEVIDCRAFTAPWYVELPTAKETLMKLLTAALQSPDPRQYLTEHPERIDELQQVAKRDADVRVLYEIVLAGPPSPRGPQPDDHQY